LTERKGTGGERSRRCSSSQKGKRTVFGIAKGEEKGEGGYERERTSVNPIVEEKENRKKEKLLIFSWEKRWGEPKRKEGGKNFASFPNSKKREGRKERPTSLQHRVRKKEKKEDGDEKEKRYRARSIVYLRKKKEREKGEVRFILYERRREEKKKKDQKRKKKGGVLKERCQKKREGGKNYSPLSSSAGKGRKRGDWEPLRCSINREKKGKEKSAMLWPLGGKKGKGGEKMLKGGKERWIALLYFVKERKKEKKP